jgi:hypothetical protein
MLNLEKVKSEFKEIDFASESQIFAYKNNLTFDISVNCKDIRVSDSKGNEVCIFKRENSSNLETRYWVDKVSKKLEKAVEKVTQNFELYYQ